MSYTARDKGIVRFTCLFKRGRFSVVANTTEALQKNADKNGNENYWHYKYCEEEWEIWNGADKDFEIISKTLQKHLDENDEKFTVPNTFFYNYLFQEFRNKILNIYIDSLEELVNNGFFKKYKKGNVFINLHVREYISQKEAKEIVYRLNGGEIAKEYIFHIEDII